MNGGLENVEYMQPNISRLFVRVCCINCIWNIARNENQVNILCSSFSFSYICKDFIR